MRTFVCFASWVVAVSLVVGCTKHNPASCCSTPAQCQMFGLGGITGCNSGQVCDLTGTCVAPQCTTSAQCMAPDPVCIDQVCVPSCTVDNDCMGIAGHPYCASDGTCVACLKDSECTTADAPVCDMTKRACRGCNQDAECASGVCLEADGTCAADAAVIYVVPGGSDSGTCPMLAPCATLSYAFSQLTATRNVVHILSNRTFDVGTATVSVPHAVYLDGINTTITGGPTTGSLFDITSPQGQITFSGLVVNKPITSSTTATVRVYGSTFAGTSGVTTTGGSLVVSSSHFNGGASPTCQGGTLDVRHSAFSESGVASTNCQATLLQNVFTADSTGSGYALLIKGGVVTVENNLIVEGYELADAASILSVAPGSVIAFNTIVNTSPVVSDGQALVCDSTATVTSNIFAYGSMHPIGPLANPCQARYSLFDKVALPSLTTGTNNLVGDGATFFANKAAKDFHLGATSPALQHGEVVVGVSVDLDGNARPNPTGTAPDMGAYEAP
jgi:hypothetical protein